MAMKSNALRDLIAFVALVVLIVGLGAMMRGMQAYIAGDWRSVAACRSTYWQCHSEFSGASVAARGSMTFTADAKACAQVKAYDTAIRRAGLDCTLSRSTRRNSCREVKTQCGLPNSPDYY
jgi:hypothetical protein